MEEETEGVGTSTMGGQTGRRAVRSNWWQMPKDAADPAGRTCFGAELNALACLSANTGALPSLDLYAPDLYGTQYPGETLPETLPQF